MQSVRFDRAVSYYGASRGFAPGVAERIRDTILSKATAKDAQQDGMGQVVAEGQGEQEAKGDVNLGLADDGPVRARMMVLVSHLRLVA